MDGKSARAQPRREVEVDVPALPDLSDDRPIDVGLVEAFARDGHCRVDGLATAAEVAAYRFAILNAADECRYDHRPLEARDTYGKAFLQCMNLWRVDPVVEAFVTARRFAHVAAQLLGVDGVRLYHDQALVKEGHGGPTPWHQDQHYWPLDTDRTVTMWMPLRDVDEVVGSMTFASGSHRLGDLGGHEIGDSSQAHFETLVADRELPLTTYGALRAGDATFHAGWTLHSSAPNPTSEDRPVMTIIYFADGTRILDDVSEASRAFDLAMWLSGCESGGPAAGPGNPVLWP